MAILKIAQRIESVIERYLNNKQVVTRKVIELEELFKDKKSAQ